MKKIILATSNSGKIHEMLNVLVNSGFKIVTQKELGIKSKRETGLTFIENAILKARYISQITSLPTVADDSGLIVNALNGKPGIYSAHYAGKNATDQDNIKRLLNNLKNVPDDQREAQFYCVLVYLRHANDQMPMIFHGIWKGKITHMPIGTGGFGYDSIFYVPTLNKTAAELSKDEKLTVSHRGKALTLLLDNLSRNV